MNARLKGGVHIPFLGGLILAVVACGGELPAQTNSPTEILAAMDQCREQVISRLSITEKLKFRSAMSAIQNNPQFIAANNAVKHAATPEAQIQARRALADVKLDLMERQDPSLKPAIGKIRAAQASTMESLRAR